MVFACMHHLLKHCCLAYVLAALCLVAASRARAVEIRLRLSPDSASPAFDRDQSQLTGIMNAAATFWEGVIQDDHVVEVTYGYQDLNDRLSASGLLPNGQINNRPTHGFVAFDTVNGNGAPWSYYFDPTPADHSEFDMRQTLARDLGDEQFNYVFVGTPPPVLEVGHQGRALPAAPDLALTGYDAVSIAAHELGHILGLNHDLRGSSGSTDSGDYLIWQDQFGNTAAAQPFGSSGEDLNHLRAPMSAMFPSFQAGQRTLPSATDILAAGAIPGWKHYQLVRKDYFATSQDVGMSLNTPNNWIGNQVPGAGDTAYVRVGPSTQVNPPTLTEPLTVGEMVVGNGSRISTGAHRLEVLGTLTMEAIDSADHNNIYTAIINPATVSAGAINLIGPSELQLEGGTVNVGRLTTTSSPEGRAFVGGWGSSMYQYSFDSGGGIYASGPTRTETLTISSSTGAPIDLDGSLETGTVIAKEGNLDIQAPLTDDFDGQMQIYAGRTIRLKFASTNNTGKLGTRGQYLFFNDDISTGPATFESPGLIVNGNIEVHGSQQNSLAIINAPVEFQSGANVSFAQTGRLRLPQTTTYAGGTYRGNGTIEQDGNAVVAEDTTIDVSTFDLDGSTGNNTVTVNPGRMLTINSQQIEATSSDGSDNSAGFGGTLTLNSGSLTVANAWRLDGTLNVNNTGEGVPTIRGGAITFAEGSLIKVTGEARVQSFGGFQGGVFVAGARAFGPGPVTPAGHIKVLDGATFFPSANIYIEQGAQFSVGGAGLDVLIGNTGGDRVFYGGRFTGGGRLNIGDDILIAGTTAFETAELDWDGEDEDSVTTIQPGATLTIASNSIEPDSSNGYDGATHILGGVLTVQAGWRLDGTLTMNAPPGTTSALTGAGPFRAHAGSTITIDGDAVVSAPITIAGTANIRSGSTTLVNYSGLEAPGLIRVAGNLYASGATPAVSAGEVRLEGGAVHFEGGWGNNGVVSGTGRDESPQFVNNGLVQPGFADGSGGELEFTNYRQTELGVLEIGADPYKNFKFLVSVDNVAELDGEFVLRFAGLDRFDAPVNNGSHHSGGISVLMADGSVRFVSDSYTIMQYGSRIGTFDEVVFPDDLPGLQWSINYLDDRITVTTTTLPGDINLDGHVNHRDIALFTPFLGQADGFWTSGDFNADGLTTLADLSIIQGHLGDSLPGVSRSPNAVPEPVNLILLALTSVVLLTVRVIRSVTVEGTIAGKSN